MPGNSCEEMNFCSTTHQSLPVCSTGQSSVVVDTQNFQVLGKNQQNYSLHFQQKYHQAIVGLLGNLRILRLPRYQQRSHTGAKSYRRVM